MFFLILLGLLSLIAIVGTVVHVSRDGYAPAAARPGTAPGDEASRHVGGAR
ncbi:MAG: hypothetical protein JWR01_1173 [Subtercola sp.]|nr:hypothetical protein [Subtercola sp.]